MFDALSEKVAEVHRGCLGDRMTNLSTLEKLTNIENRMSTLLLGLDSIPKEILEMMKKIKDSEKRSRYSTSQHSRCVLLYFLLLNAGTSWQEQ